MQQQQEGTYTFANQPRAVPNRKKYRDDFQEGDERPGMYGNIMYDRRVVRGNTYAQHTLPASAQPDPIEIQRQQEARRRAIARKRAKQQLRPRSPEPVEGRLHIHVQTELYLEELSDRVEEADVDVQTDAFLDRPPSPMFIPAKTGADIATQIMEGDLFDFNIEVKPVLEVLIGKTVEQSLLEVMEEEELANLRAQQREFEELRNAEIVEQQRLEEQERRIREEKDRRMKQQRDILRKERETSEKIAARAFAQSYLSDLVPSVFGTLADNGYFYDPVERDVEQGFLPWLMSKVEEKLSRSNLGRIVVDGLLREVVLKRSQEYASLEAEENAKYQALHPLPSQLQQPTEDNAEEAPASRSKSKSSSKEQQVNVTTDSKSKVSSYRALLGSSTQTPVSPEGAETEGQALEGRASSSRSRSKKSSRNVVKTPSPSQEGKASLQERAESVRSEKKASSRQMDEAAEGATEQTAEAPGDEEQTEQPEGEQDGEGGGEEGDEGGDED